jgi:elongation factor G
VDFTAEVERSLRVLDGACSRVLRVAGVQPQSETVWRQADRYHVPRIAFINKMDRVGANFERAIQSMRDRLGARPVPIQLPIGAEDQFKGVIDLLTMKSITYTDDTVKAKEIIGDVPADLRELAEMWRNNLVEAAAESDDELMEKLPGRRRAHRGRNPLAIRKATIARLFTPVCCGTALRNKGVQQMLNNCGGLPALAGRHHGLQGHAPGQRDASKSSARRTTTSPSPRSHSRFSPTRTSASLPSSACTAAC